MKGLRKYLTPFAPDQSGAVSVLYEFGGIIVICDAGGCTGNICGFDEPRWFESKSALFSAGLRDMDAILGRDDRLVAKLADAVTKLDAKFAAIIGTPVPAVIGTDYHALKRMTEKKVDLPILTVDTDGMELYDKGEEKAWQELFRVFAGEKEDVIPGNIGILGMTPQDISDLRAADRIREHFAAEGKTAICYGMGNGLDDVKSVSNVEKHIVAETVNDVYDTLPHRRENFRWVIDNTHDTLCFNCGRRDTCWKQEYAATLEGMEALRPLLEQNGGLETAQLPGQLSRCIHPAALCAAASRSFALYRSRREARLHAEAMRTALTEQYSAVAEALGVLGEQLGRPGDPEPYSSGRVADFFAGLGTPPQECAVTLDDLGRTHAAVTLPRTRFSAQELAALAGEVGRICRRTLEVPQVLSCKGMTTLLWTPMTRRLWSSLVSAP